MPYRQEVLPPFLQGLLIAQQQGNQESQMGLQRAQTAMGMQGALQKQQQEAAFRQAIAGAPQSEWASIAARHGGPEGVLRHEANRESIEQRRESTRARLAEQARRTDLEYETRIQASKDRAEAQRWTEQRDRARLALNEASLRMTGERLFYDTGTRVDVPQANLAAPQAAPQAGVPPEILAGRPPAEVAAIQAISQAGNTPMTVDVGNYQPPQAAPQPSPAPAPQAPLPMLAPVAPGGAMDMTGSTGTGIETPSPLPAPLMPGAQQRPAPQMPQFTGSPRQVADAQNRWLAAQGKSTLNLTGGRESVYVQRMMMGANQAAKDLANVVQLPLTASTGFFGGRRQGAGLIDAGKEVLANKATGQEAQAYNAMATGFQRSLAQIESAGLMPSGSLTHQMDAVLFKEGDTNLTKLHKLAQTRQIVEAGMEVIDANPRVSPEEKAKIKGVLDSVRASVPFTHSDLIQLQVLQDTNPNATLKDVLNKKDKWSVVR